MRNRQSADTVNISSEYEILWTVFLEKDLPMKYISIQILLTLTLCFSASACKQTVSDSEVKIARSEAKLLEVYVVRTALKLRNQSFQDSGMLLLPGQRVKLVELAREPVLINNVSYDFGVVEVTKLSSTGTGVAVGTAGTLAIKFLNENSTRIAASNEGSDSRDKVGTGSMGFTCNGDTKHVFWKTKGQDAPLQSRNFIANLYNNVRTLELDNQGRVNTQDARYFDGACYEANSMENAIKEMTWITDNCSSDGYKLYDYDPGKSRIYKSEIDHGFGQGKYTRLLLEIGLAGALDIDGGRKSVERYMDPCDTNIMKKVDCGLSYDRVKSWNKDWLKGSAEGELGEMTRENCSQYE